MTDFSDLKVGDPVLVINGRQTSVFNARVTQVASGHIQVYLPKKREHQWYQLNGKALGATQAGLSQATLARPDDEKIEAVRLHLEFKRLHRVVIAATTDFNRNPTAVNGAALTDAVKAWREHAVLKMHLS